jgi:hypothetical protein|tara:strand:- start:2360 stop:2578 length:219 start_codon:yes stop_codon:yes gene_type:complete
VSATEEIILEELAQTLNRIANQADSASAVALYSTVTGTSIKYCEALGRTIEDLLEEIRSKLSVNELSDPHEP